MAVEKAIIATLKAHAGLTALVSDRVYGVHAPQNVTAPYVTLFRVSAERPSAMGDDTGIVRARVQVNSWGATYASAKDVGEQVRAALQRFSGAAGGITVLDTFLLTEQDLHEPDVPMYHVAQDFEAIFRE